MRTPFPKTRRYAHPVKKQKAKENYRGPPRRIALQLPSARSLSTPSSTLSPTTSTSTVRTIPPRSNSSSTPGGSGPPAEISTPGRPTLGVSGRRDRAVRGLSVYRERAVPGREGVSGRRCAAVRCSGLLLGPSMTNIGRAVGDEGAESYSQLKVPAVGGRVPRARVLAAIMARFCVTTSNMVARRTAPLKVPRGPVLETWYVRSTQRMPHLRKVNSDLQAVGVSGAYNSMLPERT